MLGREKRIFELLDKAMYDRNGECEWKKCWNEYTNFDIPQKDQSMRLFDMFMLLPE